MKIVATAAILCLLTVTGCSAPAATVAATPTPSPSPSKSLPQTYGSLIELRDAAKAAGYTCVSWVQHNRVKLAAESGSCGDNDVLSTYLSQEDTNQVVANLKALTDVSLLVGPNWVINTPDGLEKLQKAMGGTIVRS